MRSRNTQMTVTTEDRGQQNLFAKEPPMYYEQLDLQTHNEKAELANSRWAMLGKAELANSRWAMLGFAIGIISKITTGSFFFFGLFN